MRLNPALLAAATLAIALPTLPGEARAQRDNLLRPALVRAEAGTTGALHWDLERRLNLAGEPDLARNWFRDGFLRVGSKGAAALHADRNPESLRGSAALGYSVRYNDTSSGKDSGLFDVGFQTDFESDQRFDRSQASASGVLAWVNTLDALWMLLPSFELTGGVVFPVERSSGEDRDRLTRWAADATWALRADDAGLSGPLEPLVAHLRVRAFDDRGGAPAESASRDGVFTAIALAYGIDHLGGGVFVQYSRGTLPAAERRPRAWSFGLDLPTGWMGLGR